MVRNERSKTFIVLLMRVSWMLSRTLQKRYQKGKQVKKSCEKAAFWYQKAAFSGDEKAKGHLEKFFEKYNRKGKC